MVNTSRDTINGRPREENLEYIGDTHLHMQTNRGWLSVWIPFFVTDEIGNEFALVRKDPTIELISMTNTMEKIEGHQLISVYAYRFSNKGLPFKKSKGKLVYVPTFLHKLKDHNSGKIVFHEKTAMSLLNVTE